MQHLDSKYREEDVADEVQIEDLLQRRAEKLDVGSLAGGRCVAGVVTRRRRPRMAASRTRYRSGNGQRQSKIALYRDTGKAI